jgi:hypothetical protein
MAERKAQMAEHNELSFEQLVDWVDGRLTAEDAGSLARQVMASQPELQAEAAWLHAFRQMRQQIMLARPPAAVRQVLLARFADYAQGLRSPSLIQRIVAALTFDSLLQPLPAGVRGEEARPRQLVFAAERLDLVLNIHPRPGDERLDLLGQILPNDMALTPESFAIQLLRDETEVAMAMADDLGEFDFTALTSGAYRLVLSGEDMEITLPAIELMR